MKWPEYFKNIAHQVSLKSKDDHTQIGAVIVGPENEIVSTGYNSFPRGINDNVSERQARPEKYFWFEHAERNAIYNAARIGVSTKGCTIYLTSDMPCADCARGIINSGIVKVVITLNGAANSAKWKRSAKRSAMMFSEAKVIVDHFKDI